MRNLFLVYFVKLYMFRAYLGPSSGATTICTQQVVLIGSNPTSTTYSHLKRIISTNCCIHTVVPPDDGPRYARNMKKLTKYTKNKMCIKLGFLYTRVPYTQTPLTFSKTPSYHNKWANLFLTFWRRNYFFNFTTLCI